MGVCKQTIVLVHMYGLPPFAKENLKGILFWGVCGNKKGGGSDPPPLGCDVFRESLFDGIAVARGDFGPVDDFPEGFDIASALILVFEVVGMFPHVES